MKIRTMIVDDEQPTLDLLRIIIEPHNCDVFTFQDSLAAAQSLDSDRFDFIIVDISMPVVDGFELCQRARSSRWNQHSPIAMITGLSDAETVREGFKAGADFFLAKPFQTKEVVKIVNVVAGAVDLHRRRSRRLPFRSTVQCRVADKSFEAPTINIGENGMLLQLPSWVDETEPIQIELLLPGVKRPLTIHAKTFRKDEAGQMAVEFLDLGLGGLERIQKYLSPD